MNNNNTNDHYKKPMLSVGYVSRAKATVETYQELGFNSGLEIHQQLMTVKKLFCRCPAGLYQNGDDYDAELIRHMRPTLSELGEYDGTALMEFKTRKNIIYRIKDESACTYDIDDTPPFAIDREALDKAIGIALLLGTNIVGELHITRKQYLDGSIPTGFQRTAIIGIEGEIPLGEKNIRIIQLSLEEDSCREVLDEGHWRTFTTDRLGIPLIETVTAPDMKTPDEVAQAAHYLRYLARSTNNVRTGIGAAREDVNVSVRGGTRVEIKGVAHIKWIPELTHNEAFRQKALLIIKDKLASLKIASDDWKMSFVDLIQNNIVPLKGVLNDIRKKNLQIIGINLPGFKGLLSFFTQPGKKFANELSDRLKVIACIEKPNMIHSEEIPELSGNETVNKAVWDKLASHLGADDKDAQLILWGDSDDIKMAIETIEERCRLAFNGVPNETRKALADGTTIFERVLPGPDRMYPDTDSAPIPIEDEHIERIKKDLPVSVRDRVRQLREWDVPADTYGYLLRRNLVWLIEKIIKDFNLPPRYVGTLFGHTFRGVERKITPSADFNDYAIYGMFKFINSQGLNVEIAEVMLPGLYAHPKMVFDSILNVIGYKMCERDSIVSLIPNLIKKFDSIKRNNSTRAKHDWVMGHLRKMAIGNVALKEIAIAVEKECAK
ncbi:MAG: Glu-tRNA(Gln) amidotransferase subunit GatE [candidate division Zixibacteria bacterium]